MDLDPYLTAKFLKAFTKPFGVWDYHVNMHVVVAADWQWFGAWLMLYL